MAARPAALPDGTQPVFRSGHALSAFLTDEQQEAWNAAAAKVLSHPRLGQCGPLTGQEHFVGINSSRARIDRDWQEAFGEPEPGRKVFIRTRQQHNGWEDKATDLSELVPANPLAARSRTGIPPVPVLLAWLPMTTMSQSPVMPLAARITCSSSARFILSQTTPNDEQPDTTAPPVKARISCSLIAVFLIPFAAMKATLAAASRVPLAIQVEPCPD